MFKFIKMLQRSENIESPVTMSRRILSEEKGATAIEYGLIAALIAVAAVGAFTSVGNGINRTFNAAANSLTK